MQIDLSEASALPLSLDLETGELIASGDVHLGERGERRLSQLRDVLADPDAVDHDRICYRTYRGVGTRSDRELLRKHGLRFDITVTLPGLIGREYMKTAGHRHSIGRNGEAFPEVYEVTYGRAAFVLEFVRSSSGYASIPICEPCDRITVPIENTHVTVNVGAEPLVVCNLVASDCVNEYGKCRSNRGALYYIVQVHDGIAIEPNADHSVPVPLIRPPEMGHSSKWPERSRSDIPLIESFRREPESFRFLTETPFSLVD